MQKIMTALLLVISMGTMAQKNITIVPTNLAEQNTRKNVVLNVSDFIPIQKGDAFKLQPNLTSLPRQHKFLKGVLKSAAVFALTSQVNKAVNNNSKIGSPSTNLAPVIAISLATGLPNMVQGLKNKKSYLVYTMYDANKMPVTTQKILLKKPYDGFTLDKATADGFLKVEILGNSKKVLAGNLTIAISEQKAMNFKGQMAEEFNLDAYGDCQGGGGGNCDAIFIAASAAALALYIEEMAFCATLVLPPLIAACVGVATIGYAAILVLLALDLKECKKGAS